MQLRTRRSGILTTTADLALQIGSLLEALDRARSAMRAADPSGRLWAACVLFLRQAQRFGVSASRARGVRAQRERRLGELAERAGDIRAAIVHYRAALASQAGVGVTRRLARLVAVEPTAATPPRGFANPSRAGRPSRRFDSTRGGNRAVRWGRASRPRLIRRKTHETAYPDRRQTARRPESPRPRRHDAAEGQPEHVPHRGPDARGRRPAVSERMKKYWANRRKARKS